MSPLAPRTPQDQWRGPRAYSPNEPREFLMRRAADPWRAAETWIRCLASHSVPLHAATGLSAHPEVAHLPAEPSVRSVSAKQVGYQTSSADGSSELAGAPPRCGMASLAGFSSHRRPCTRCGHIALPIVQIGVSPKGVACPAPPRSSPQSGTHWTWPVDDFHRIAQGPGHPPRQRPRDVAPGQVTATNDINPQNSRLERGVPPNEKIITPV
jgi:hypothetical protein